MDRVPKFPPSAIASTGMPSTVAPMRRELARRLAAAGVESAVLEADLLLGRALGLSRASLIARAGEPARLADERSAWLARAVERRLAGEPLAYVLGEREFYGRTFLVNRRVLVPRPETELLVAEVVRRRPGAAILCDVGTGSGAIAVTLALELPGARIVALDVSEEALAVATANAARLGAAPRVLFRRSDLLARLSGPVDVLAANLPYVSSADLAAAAGELASEPRLALDGGTDGLDLYRRFFVQLGAAPARYLRAGALVAVEVGSGQGAAVAALAGASLADGRIELLPDLAGHDRVVVVET